MRAGPTARAGCASGRPSQGAWGLVVSPAWRRRMGLPCGAAGSPNTRLKSSAEPTLPAVARRRRRVLSPPPATCRLSAPPAAPTHQSRRASARSKRPAADQSAQMRPPPAAGVGSGNGALQELQHGWPLKNGRHTKERHRKCSAPCRHGCMPDRAQRKAAAAAAAGAAVPTPSAGCEPVRPALATPSHLYQVWKGLETRRTPLCP